MSSLLPSLCLSSFLSTSPSRAVFLCLSGELWGPSLRPDTWAARCRAEVAALSVESEIPSATAPPLLPLTRLCCHTSPLLRKSSTRARASGISALQNFSYEAALGQVRTARWSKRLSSSLFVSTLLPLLLAPLAYFTQTLPPLLPRPPGPRVPAAVIHTPDLRCCRPPSSSSDPDPFSILCSSWLLGSLAPLSPFRPCVSSLFPDPRSQGRVP